MLSVPYPLRFLFASRPDLMGRVLGIVYRCIATHLIKKAGFSLACLPDVVFESEETGELLIIERKVTQSGVIPESGWPNAKAQLWCYSWIDEFQSAPSIFLSTQIWRFHNGEYHLSNKMPRWEKGEEPFESQQRELFVLFGGQCAK